MLVRNQCISDYTSHFEIHIGPFRRNSTCIERSVTKQFSNGNYASPGRLQTWGFDKVQALVSSGKPSHWQCVLLGFFVGGVEPKWATQKKNLPGYWLHHWVVVSNIFYFHPDPWGNDSHCDEHIFQRGWNHQPDDSLLIFWWILTGYTAPHSANFSYLLGKLYGSIWQMRVLSMHSVYPVEGTKNCHWCLWCSYKIWKIFLMPLV